MNLSKRSAFSMVEMLVTIGIITVMASIAIPQYNKARCKAQDDEKLTTLQSMKSQIDSCIMITNRAPTVLPAPGGIDCFEKSSPVLNQMIIDGEVTYIGHNSTAAPSHGNNFVGCDGNDPNLLTCVNKPKFFAIRFAETSCIEPDYMIYADSSTEKARLKPNVAF